MKRFLSILILWAAFPLGVALADAGDIEWNYQPHAPQQVTEPSFMEDVQLILDDGTADGSFGIGVPPGAAQQFLWFNQFDLSSLGPLNLTEVQVLFTPGSNIAAGDPVQIAIYHDADADPTNGASLLATSDEVIQVLDGVNFSTYPLGTAVELPDSGNVLIGVVGRFVSSGVTPPTDPAAIDTSASAGRSWLAVWTGDVPSQPVLPPDLFIDQVDVFLAGNWMIRGVGQGIPALDIPTLGYSSLALLVLLLSAAGFFVISRR